ncbi:MAG: hypothetical protein ACI9VT_003570 [Psychroserpens sp.]|jgi:hypothetical protein
MGIELMSTTNVTNSRLGIIDSNHIQIKQLESKKGISIYSADRLFYPFKLCTYYLNPCFITAFTL